jgi:hypothetical protein
MPALHPKRPSSWPAGDRRMSGSSKRWRSVAPRTKASVRAQPAAHRPRLSVFQRRWGLSLAASMAIKDVLQSLVDDNMVHAERIGSSNYYWAFPSEGASVVRLQLPHGIVVRLTLGSLPEEYQAEGGTAKDPRSAGPRGSHPASHRRCLQRPRAVGTVRADRIAGVVHGPKPLRRRGVRQSEAKCWRSWKPPGRGSPPSSLSCKSTAIVTRRCCRREVGLARWCACANLPIPLPLGRTLSLSGAALRVPCLVEKQTEVCRASVERWTGA